MDATNVIAFPARQAAAAAEREPVDYASICHSALIAAWLVVSVMVALAKF